MVMLSLSLESKPKLTHKAFLGPTSTDHTDCNLSALFTLTQGKHVQRRHVDHAVKWPAQGIKKGTTMLVRWPNTCPLLGSNSPIGRHAPEGVHLKSVGAP